jgi:hypothetical protein
MNSEKFNSLWKGGKEKFGEYSAKAKAQKDNYKVLGGTGNPRMLKKKNLNI